jgi:DNA-binding response OmpR family regulator
VILISGILDRSQIVQGMESELVWFLRKPFTPHELVALVQRVISGGSGTLLPE